MKNLFLLLFTALLVFSSCENTQENSSVIQAKVDSTFFKSFDAIGSIQEDGSVTMQGLTGIESLTLHINQPELGSYNVGGERTNYATFEDENGNIYYTNPYGSGKINLTKICASCGTVTGDFQFTAVLPGIDTVYISKGVFFNIPLDFGDDTPSNSGTVNANVNSAAFNAVNVTSVVSGTTLLISGGNATKTIILGMPASVAVGNYPVPGSGFQATLTLDGVTESATVGNVSIISHDTTLKTIKGSFSFTTDSNTITDGQFNISY